MIWTYMNKYNFWIEFCDWSELWNCHRCLLDLRNDCCCVIMESCYMHRCDTDCESESPVATRNHTRLRVPLRLETKHSRHKPHEPKPRLRVRLRLETGPWQAGTTVASPVATRNLLRCDSRPFYTYTLLLGLHTVTSPIDWARYLDSACLRDCLR